MVISKEMPQNERGRVAPKGRLTWMAIAGMVVFAILLGFLFLKPAMKTGGEVSAPASDVSGEAAAPAGAQTGAASPQD